MLIKNQHFTQSKKNELKQNKQITVYFALTLTTEKIELILEIIKEMPNANCVALIVLFECKRPCARSSRLLKKVLIPNQEKNA